jgi:hypothetical protein
MSLLSTRSFNARRVGCEDTGEFDARVELNATQAVQARADASGSEVTLGLRAADETNLNQWKRIGDDAKLHIEYNFPPDKPTNLHTSDPATGCATDAGRPEIIPKSSPMLVGRVEDDNNRGVNLTGVFALERFRPVAGQWAEEFQRRVEARDGSFSTEVGQPMLADGGRFRWRMRGEDPQTAGPWSPWCHLTVDVIAPPPPRITRPDFTGPFEVGRSIPDVHVDADASDGVAFFRWSVNFTVPAPGSMVDAGPLQGASFDIPADELRAAGPHVLRVWAYDAAGNMSGRQPASVIFTVNEVFPTSRYLLDEGTGYSSADDVAPARQLEWVGGSGVQWEGPSVPGQTLPEDRWLATSGSTATAVADTAGMLDTADNFSVAAWIRPAQLSTTASAVSQSGPHNPAFTLGTAADCFAKDGSGVPCYQFALRSAGGDVARVRSRVPASTGSWVLLVGTYDGSAQEATLFVREWSASTPTPAEINRSVVDVGFNPMASNGRTRVSGELSAGPLAQPWRGAVDDVIEWPDLIEDDRVGALTSGYPGATS